MTPGEQRVQFERWERWAQGWKQLLADRSKDLYYSQLPFEVAVDMILELTRATLSPPDPSPSDA